jgi:hypothetical protein
MVVQGRSAAFLAAYMLDCLLGPDSESGRPHPRLDLFARRMTRLIEFDGTGKQS